MSIFFNQPRKYCTEILKKWVECRNPTGMKGRRWESGWNISLFWGTGRARPPPSLLWVFPEAVSFADGTCCLVPGLWLKVQGWLYSLPQSYVALSQPFANIILGSKITADGDCCHEIKRHLLLGRKAMTNLDSVLKSRHYFAHKGLSSQSHGSFNCHVWMWELDCEEGWVPKNWCFWTVVLEKTLESPLDCKEIKPVQS